VQQVLSQRMRVSVAAGIVLFVTSVRAFVPAVYQIRCCELPTAARVGIAGGQNCAVRKVQSLGQRSNAQRRCQQVCIIVPECVRLWYWTHPAIWKELAFVATQPHGLKQ